MRYDDVTFSSKAARSAVTATAHFMHWTEQGDMDTSFELSATYRTGKTGWSLISVELEAHGGLAPTDLSRFPWNRWLRALELHAHAGTGRYDAESMSEWSTGGGESRAPDTDDGRRANRAVERARRVDGTSTAPAPRPGRRGHEDSFYEEVARRWRELVAGGDSAPAKTIAIERSYSLNTVNGWIAASRRKGLLPPTTANRSKQVAK